MRNIFVTAAKVSALVLVLPVFASALTTDEIEAQIRSLLAQVAALQQQLQTQSTQAVPTATVPTTTVGSSNSSVACPVLFRPVSNGMRGDDVQSLQQFLISQGHLSPEFATGYFGSLTEIAVQRMQIALGVFSSPSSVALGYGVIGPRTRAAIANHCGSSSSETSSSVGTCPIAQPPTSSCTTGWQANTNSSGCVTSYRCAVPLTSLQPTSTVGVCTAIALQCPSGTHDEVSSNCSHSCVSDTGKTPLVPPTSGNGLLSAYPTSGSAPLSVTFTSTVGDDGSYRPSYIDGADTLLDFGDGSAEQWVQCSVNSGASLGGGKCSVPARIQHTYSQNGTYTVTLKRSGGYCYGNCTTILATATITVGKSTQGSSCPIYSPPLCNANQHLVGGAYNSSTGCYGAPQCVSNTGTSGAPVVTGVDGPATLKTGERGTWTVRASTPSVQNASLKYSVTWGDEYMAYASSGMSAQAQQSISTSGTFTHAYSFVGTFSPRFTVSNDSGSASFATSVQVSGDGLLGCPIYMQTMQTQSEMLIACPAGQHWEAGKPTYDSRGCTIPGYGKCVPDVPTSSTFSASPTSGSAPLSVTFSTSQQLANGQFVADAGSYKIVFGDGSEYVLPCTGSSPGCNGPHTISHTYTNAGTYTASLVHFGYYGVSLDGTPPMNTVGTTTITVGGSPLSCPLYQQPICPAGQYVATRTDSNGCSVPYCAIGDSSGVSKCKEDLTALDAHNASQPSGTLCGQGGPSLRCPYDSSIVYGSLSTCATGFLQQRGWVSVSSSADTNTNLANALSALEALLKKFLGQ